MSGMSWKSSFPPKLCKLCTVEELPAAPWAALTPLAPGKLWEQQPGRFITLLLTGLYGWGILSPTNKPKQ